MPSDSDLRCFCGKRPLLARVGRDERGRPFGHIKVFKGGRVFGELLLEHGVLRLRCRECGRWHTLRLERQRVDFSGSSPNDSPAIAAVESG